MYPRVEVEVEQRTHSGDEIATSRSEAMLEVTFEGTFEFSFDVRRMEDVLSFF